MTTFNRHKHSMIINMTAITTAFIILPRPLSLYRTKVFIKYILARHIFNVNVKKTQRLYTFSYI